MRQRALMPWTVKLLVVAMLAVGLTACGDDDDDEPTVVPATVAAPTQAAADAAAGTAGVATQATANASPIAGGGNCWTDDQRIADLNGKPQWSAAPAMTIDPAKAYTARFETSHGGFTVELFPQDAPQTVNSFVCLARAGFFDGIVFHRVVAGFVIQAGDPTGTGGEGPGYQYADELPTTLNYERGTLAMANAGPNTNGSQFFVCLDDLSQGLPKNYSIFGRVTEGLETVDAIGAVAVQPSRTDEMSSPVEPVTITSVTVTEG